MKNTTIKYIPTLILASIMLVFSAASQASGFISHHGNSVNISVGFKHHDAYGHRSNRHRSFRNNRHNYSQKRYYNPRNYSRRYNNNYNRGFNRGFRSGFSRSYCPSGY